MYITMQYHTVVCNNAVPYRSSHHLPVTVERNTHTQSNARTLHLKWSFLALHMGQHPNLLRLQRRRLSQFIGNQFMGNPINPHLLEKKESFYLRQRFNSHRTILAGLGHHYGRRYIVRETNMAVVKS